MKYNLLYYHLVLSGVPHSKEEVYIWKEWRNDIHSKNDCTSTKLYKVQLFFRERYKIIDGWNLPRSWALSHCDCKFSVLRTNAGIEIIIYKVKLRISETPVWSELNLFRTQFVRMLEHFYNVIFVILPPRIQ